MRRVCAQRGRSHQTRPGPGGPERRGHPTPLAAGLWNARGSGTRSRGGHPVGPGTQPWIPASGLPAQTLAQRGEAIPAREVSPALARGSWSDTGSRRRLKNSRGKQNRGLPMKRKAETLETPHGLSKLPCMSGKGNGRTDPGLGVGQGPGPGAEDTAQTFRVRGTRTVDAGSAGRRATRPGSPPAPCSPGRTDIPKGTWSLTLPGQPSWDCGSTPLSRGSPGAWSPCSSVGTITPGLPHKLPDHSLAPSSPRFLVP